MAQTLVSATLADAFSAAFVKGLECSSGRLDLADALLTGGQVGASFIAYPIGARWLEKNCAFYRRKGQGHEAFRYVANAVAASAFTAGLCYPIARAQEVRRTGKTTFSGRELYDSFAEGILPNIGFPLAADCADRMLPHCANSVAQWARGSFVVALGGLGSDVAAWPLVIARRGAAAIPETFAGWFRALPAVVSREDAFGTFSRITACLAS